MQSWTKRDYFTYLVLFILLFVRFPIADFVLFLQQFSRPFLLPINFENLRLLQNHSLQFLYGYSLIVVAIVIIANRNNLNRLNIDKSFLWVFTWGCLAYNWGSWQLRLATVLLAVSVLILGVKGMLKFGDKNTNTLRMVLIIAIVFFLGILIMADSINFTRIHWVIQGTLLRGGSLSAVVVEEIMFRGMLWMLLKDLNFSEIKIVSLQAILFWISHVYAFNNLAFFWINVPMISILLGIIVWRSKSITLSAIAHILINMLLGFVAFRNL